MKWRFCFAHAYLADQICVSDAKELVQHDSSAAKGGRAVVVVSLWPLEIEGTNIQIAVG